MSSGTGSREEAPRAQSNEDLVRRFVEACRHTRTILPATTTIERICADADAERRIEARIAERVPPGLRRDLEYLLEETVDAGVTRFVWLRQFEPGNNSADANRLLDRLEHLRRLAVPEGLFHDVPAHRITRLRRQGERYFADGLRELPDSRRLAILAVCAVEWELFLADAVVETHDRIVAGPRCVSRGMELQTVTPTKLKTLYRSLSLRCLLSEFRHHFTKSLAIFPSAYGSRTEPVLKHVFVDGTSFDPRRVGVHALWMRATSVSAAF